METPELALVERLRQAVAEHDLDGLVDCFTGDYRNETPAHPGRGFEGRDQVRTNWTRIFAGVPDITAEVLRATVDRDVVWSEWEMRGTRPDGQPHLMRGVIIFGVTGRRAAWARFYLEPVDPGEGGVDAAISSIVDAQVGDMTTVVRDARPPTAMVATLNPILRTLLRTPFARLAKHLALLEFSGRSSGRRYRVPVGWHEADGLPVVFTPAPWRANFAGGAPATVHHRGRAQRMMAALVTDPAEVARALESVLAAGTPPRLVGLDIPTGHSVTAADVALVGRAMIRLRAEPADN